VKTCQGRQALKVTGDYVVRPFEKAQPISK